MKTREELKAMTMRELRAYAKEVGCCLGYDGSRKDTAVAAIMAYERYVAYTGSKGGGDHGGRA